MPQGQLPDGRKFTKAELEDAYGQLHAQWMEADRRGDLVAKESIKRRMMTIGRQAFS